MKSIKQFLAENDELIHAKMKKVVSHVQRQQGDWFLNTVLIDQYDVPFKYKRKRRYQSLQGARVDMIYYADKENIAGMEFEFMKVVKIAQS